MCVCVYAIGREKNILIFYASKQSIYLFLSLDIYFFD